MRITGLAYMQFRLSDRSPPRSIGAQRGPGRVGLGHAPGRRQHAPEAFGRYRDLLGDGLPLQPLARLEFYAACREPDLAVCVATGDSRLSANVLLTIGFIQPPAAR
jgi:hypothetical protein